MRVINLPNKYKKLSADELFQKLDSFRFSKYILSEKISEILAKIKDFENLKIILYILISILENNNLAPSNLNPKPSNGIQLSNPDTKFPLGVYHVHLNNSYVLIWYITNNRFGKNIIMEYIKHPPGNDNYLTILQDIYSRNDDGFNEDRNVYFKDSTKETYFDITIYENIIKRFDIFKKLFK